MISDPLVLSVILIGIMFFFLLSSIWIGAALMLTQKAGDLLAGSMYDSMNSWSLAALPMFILMGEILYHSSISTRLLNGLMPWLAKVPGRLLHVNVAACSLFAAVSGSSAATTATVGKITLGELKSRGYSKKLAIGSLAGSGTLGFLIPPSLIMIIYGVLSDVSIGKLFIAGVLPGLLLATSYSVYIMIVSSIDKTTVPSTQETFSNMDRLNSLKDLAPIWEVFMVVLQLLLKQQLWE